MTNPLLVLSPVCVEHLFYLKIHVLHLSVLEHLLTFIFVYLSLYFRAVMCQYIVQDLTELLQSAKTKTTYNCNSQRKIYFICFYESWNDLNKVNV